MDFDIKIFGAMLLDHFREARDPRTCSNQEGFRRRTSEPRHALASSGSVTFFNRLMASPFGRKFNRIRSQYASTVLEWIKLGHWR